jgi:four helix bundle protein
MVLRANAGHLLVHQIAAQVAQDVSRLATSFRGPAAEQRSNQIVRAACSVVSNISEACGRGTTADFRQSLNYARGSAHELRSQLEVARLLAPKHAATCKTLESRVTLVIKMLGRLHDHPPQ